MTLAKLPQLQVFALLVCLGCGVSWCVPVLSHGGIFSPTGRSYGPTTPSGYAVRVEPQAFTMSHAQRPQVHVTVENAAGQLVDDVLVHFLPSEGTMTTGSSHTRGGVVTGMFTVASGSDNPRSAFIIVTVEDIEVTVFIDIVPTVVGR